MKIEITDKDSYVYFLPGNKDLPDEKEIPWIEYEIEIDRGDLMDLSFEKFSLEAMKVLEDEDVIKIRVRVVKNE